MNVLKEEEEEEEDMEEEGEVDVSNAGRMAISHMNVLKEEEVEEEVVVGMEVVVAEVVDVSNVEKTDTRHMNVLEEEVVEDLEDLEVVDIEDRPSLMGSMILLTKCDKWFWFCILLKNNHDV